MHICGAITIEVSLPHPKFCIPCTSTNWVTGCYPADASNIPIDSTQNRLCLMLLLLLLHHCSLSLAHEKPEEEKTLYTKNYRGNIFYQNPNKNCKDAVYIVLATPLLHGISHQCSRLKQRPYDNLMKRPNFNNHLCSIFDSRAKDIFGNNSIF